MRGSGSSSRSSVPHNTSKGNVARFYGNPEGDDARNTQKEKKRASSDVYVEGCKDLNSEHCCCCGSCWCVRIARPTLAMYASTSSLFSVKTPPWPPCPDSSAL